MLIGQYHTKISSKGRTALPAKFRRELGKTVVVSRWYEGCIAIFSQQSWQEVLSKALGRSLLTRPTRATERFLLGGAYEVEPDVQGRLVIPPPLRKHAGLSDQVAFIGVRDRVEVWDKGVWLKQEAKISKDAEGLIEEVQKQPTTDN